MERTRCYFGGLVGSRPALVFCQGRAPRVKNTTSYLRHLTLVLRDSKRTHWDAFLNTIQGALRWTLQLELEVVS